MNETQLGYLEYIKKLAETISIESVLDKFTVEKILELIDEIKAIEKEKWLILRDDEVKTFDMGKVEKACEKLGFEITETQESSGVYNQDNELIMSFEEVQESFKKLFENK